MTTNRESLRVRGALCAALMLLFTLQQASADTIATWSGSTSTDWNNGANWSTNPTVPNGFGSYSATIPGTGTATNQPTLAVGINIDNLTLQDATTSLTINSGGSLGVIGTDTTSNAGTITVNAGGTYHFEGSGTSTLSGGGTLNLAGGIINTSSNDGMTFANGSTIAGYGAIGTSGYGFTLSNSGTVNANSNGNTMTLGSGVTSLINTGTLEATNSGSLTLSSVAVNNAGGTISASGGGTVTLSGSSVADGSLSSTGGTMNATGNASLSGSVGLTGQLTVTDSNNVNLNAGSGGMTLTGGTLAVGTSTGATIGLTNSGGANTFQGGTVTLTNGWIQALSNNGMTVLNNGVNGTSTGIIQGSGQIGLFGMTINNASGSVIDANQTGATLNLGYNLDTINNSGTLEATNGGVLTTYSANINNVGGTILSSGTGSTVNLTNSAQITGGTLQTASGGVLNLTGSAVLIGSVTIASGSTVNVPASGNVYLNAGSSGMTLINNGSLIAGTSGNIYLEDNSTSQAVTLNGTGSVTLNGGFLAPASNDAAGGMVLNANQTIQGYGTIGLYNLVVNNGAGNVINANVSGQTLQLGYNLDTITNLGTLEASNGGILFLEEATVNNVGGTILANGGTVNITGGSYDVITGGTLQTQNSGILNVGGSSVLQGSMTIASGSTVTVESATNTATSMFLNAGSSGMTLTNNGSLVAITNSNIYLVDDGTSQAVTLNGTGTLTLNGGYLAPQSNDSPIGMVLNNNQTIQGYGTIGYYDLVINNGVGAVINANQSGQTLQLGYNLDTINNSGTLEATNGGILLLQEATVSGGLILANGGTVNIIGSSDVISGGTLQTENGGVMNFGGGSQLEGTETIAAGSTVNVATASGAASFGYLNALSSGMTLVDNGSLVVGSGSTLYLVDSNAAGETVTLNGTGNITLNGGVMEAQSNDGMKLVNNATIEGGGTIGYYAWTITNNGLILANNTGTPLDFVAATTLTNGSTGILQTALNSTMIVEGNLTNFSGSTLTGGTYINAGLLEFAGANIVTNQANIIMDSAAGAIENSTNSANALANFITNGPQGTFTVRNGANFTPIAGFTNGGIMNAGDLSSISSGNGSTLTFSNSGQSNTGTINAINEGTVDFNSAFTNSGAINAGNASAGTVSNVNITAAITNTGGSINALFDGIVNVTGATITNGAVTTVSGGVLNLDQATLSNVAVTNAGTLNSQANSLNTISGTINNSGTIAIAANSTLNVGGVTSFINSGNITLNDPVIAASVLSVGGSAISISGGGTITMNNNPGNYITGTAGGSFTDVDNLIQGSGYIGATNGIAEIGFANESAGTVTANQSTPLIIQATGTVTNAGLFQANSGGTLTLQSDTITNTGGTITAGNTGTVNVNSTGITGGTVSTALGGILNLNTGTLTSVALTNAGTLNTVTGTTDAISGTINNTGTMAIANNSTLNVAGTTSFANNGNINLNASGSNTALSVGGSSVTVTGTGSITLSNDSHNLITGTSGGSFTNSGNTIQGSGNIGNGVIGFNNSGTVTANNSATALIIQATGAVTNTGTLQANSGATLTLSGDAITNTNGTVTAGGASAGAVNVNSSSISGGTVSTATNGTINLNSGTVTGGTVTNGGTLATVSGSGNNLGGAITNQSGANINIANNSTLGLSASGTVTNVGSINLNGAGSSTALSVSGTVTLSGGGTVILSNDSHNTIRSTGTATLANVNNTIEGAGTISAGLNNEAGGTIMANDSTALLITPSSGNTFTQNGTVDVSAGDTLTVSTAGGGTFANFSGGTLTGGTYDINGTFQFTGANTSFATNASNITLNGAGAAIQDTNASNGLADLSSNTGTLDVTGGASVTTAANLNNSGTMLVGSGSSVGGSGTFTENGGSLEVDGSLNYGTVDLTNSGTITGDGTIDPAMIDNISGILNPTFAGTPGIMDIDGSYTQGAGGTLDIGLGPSSQGELVVQNGDPVSLNGILDVTALMGYSPIVTVYTILSDLGGSITGTFSDVILPSIDGYTFQLGYNSTSVTLSVSTSGGGGGGGGNGTPEPSTWTMMGLGLAAAFVALKKRRSARISR